MKFQSGKETQEFLLSKCRYAGRFSNGVRSNRVIEHKTLFVCLALAFCVHWSIFVAGVTCRSGQTSATPSLRGGRVVGFCMHARAHTGLRAYFCTHACLLAIQPAATTCCRRLPRLLPLLALRKPGPRSVRFGGHPGERS